MNSETNGFSERAVRTIKDGTAAVLLQSGLDEKCCYLRNVQDLLADEKTLYERRFGEAFKRPVILVGSMVENHPICAREQSRLHQFGAKVLPEIFLGYVLYVGGIWNGDTTAADVEEL